MATVQQGKCPFCKQVVLPKIVETGVIQRNKLQCPTETCGQYMYKCRTPGCHDFAKWTEVYDHEFCPDCTESVNNVAGAVGKAALAVAVAAGAAFAKAAATKK